MQDAKSEPSSPPVQVSPQRFEHSSTQTWKTTADVEGQPCTQACREPPGHPPLGDGAGDGTGGEGTGTGTGVGVGAGTETVPLVTQPPHSSSLGEPTALFNQHSLLAWTHVKPTQPEVAAHWLQQSSALLALPPFRFVPSLFFPSNIWHCPGGGVGVGGPGVGGLQVGGAGPYLMPCGAWTTTFVTANEASLESATERAELTL